MMNALSHEERLRLMRFVCSFAWADLEIRDEERALIRNLGISLELTPVGMERVDQWLRNPPRPEEVDPQDIPMEHRKMFLAAAQATIAVDGEIDPQEATILELFETLLSDGEE
ncbi:MAG: TerB family tellurite resistance protein [Myxococcota bacterium]